MAVSKQKGVFQADLQKTWDTVTSLQNYAWRSDISRIETVNAKQFIEYTKDGYATTFTVTACEPCQRWAFDMENANIKGHWVGVFTAQNGQTEIEFTEEATSKRVVMKPFVKGYLKKQQKQYMADLQKALE